MSDEDKPVETQSIARVRVVVEVVLSQPWSGEEKVQNVFDMAERDARERVTRMIHDYVLNRKERISMVGSPVVEIVTTTKKAKS